MRKNIRVSFPWLMAGIIFAAAGCSGSAAPEDADSGEEEDLEAPDGPVCSPENCEGCCDQGGMCRLGMDDARCGSGGETCTDCTAGGGRCVDAACLMPGCGDGVRAAGEECDGTDLGGADCRSLGFAAGSLACSAACAYDTSACPPLTCEVAAADPETYPCDFCSADGSSMIYCGFCREDPYTGLHPPDEEAPCDPGETCYRWTNAADGKDEYYCLDGPPEPCPADFTEGYCEGEVAVSCTPNGLIDRFDCAPLGQVCVMATGYVGVRFPYCVDPDAQPCTPGSYDERCEGNVMVICYELTGYETRFPCDSGTVCVEGGPWTRCIEEGWVPCDTASFTPRCDGAAVVECQPLFSEDPLLGGYEVPADCAPSMTCADTAAGSRCVRTGTSACDPDTYAAHCDGDLVMFCVTATRWEDYTDCSLRGEPGLMTCQTFASGPFCAPRDYTPCDPMAFPPRCDGSTARQCRQPGWLVERPCGGLNPVCIAGEYTADCTFAGSADCLFDMTRSIYETDHWGDVVFYRPLRCLDAATMVVCDDYLQVEMLRACDAGRLCTEDPEYYPGLDAACL
jgi:hypothetical protein